MCVCVCVPFFSVTFTSDDADFPVLAHLNLFSEFVVPTSPSEDGLCWWDWTPLGLGRPQAAVAAVKGPGEQLEPEETKGTWRCGGAGPGCSA